MGSGALSLFFLLHGMNTARCVESSADPEGPETCSVGMQHIIFPDDAYWLEGLGAKWGYVKVSLWLTLRLNQLIKVGAMPSSTASFVWLPNPAQLQNPHSPKQSMLGGLGLSQPSVLPPVHSEWTPKWLEERLAAGEYRRINFNLGLHATNRSAEFEQFALAEIRGAGNVPLAFFLEGPPNPMYWHGRTGAWLHSTFYAHRLARAKRSGRHSDMEPSRLRLPEGVNVGQYLVSVHVRYFFDAPGYSLPAAYFIAAIRVVFAYTPLNCNNAVVLIFGRSDDVVVQEIKNAVKCSHLVVHSTYEVNDGVPGQEHVEDDYGAADDLDDAQRGYVFRDLELLGLSDVLIGSQSEFSTLAQGLSAPDTITLCPPVRKDYHNGPLIPCDQTGVRFSILTHPQKWGPTAVSSSELVDVDQAHVGEQLQQFWMQRNRSEGDGPIWSRANHGIVHFDFDIEVEASWRSQFEYKESSRPP